jgi:hypothetical protein
MAKKTAAKKKRPAQPTVTLRVANPRGGSMAAKKGKGKGRKSPRRSNPTKKGHHGKRRRNPTTFLDRVGRLAGVAAIALGSGAATYVATSRIAPGSPASLYGIPAGVFLIGAAAYRTMPTLGAGLAIGAVSPFALPIASKAASMIAPSSPSSTAAGITRSLRNIRAVSMGRNYDMGAVDMGAVDMMGRAYGRAYGA